MNNGWMDGRILQSFWFWKAFGEFHTVLVMPQMYAMRRWVLGFDGDLERENLNPCLGRVGQVYPSRLFD